MKVIRRIRYERGEGGYHITVFAPSGQYPMYRIICSEEGCGYHGLTERATIEEVETVIACILRDAPFEEVAA